MRLEQDWHIHTFRSLCGKPDSTVPAIVAKLDSRGIRLAGISDHIDIREQREWFTDVVRQNRADLAALNPRCKVLVGTEATMLDPQTCALEADLAAELDFVIVACNHYHLEQVENPLTETPQAYADHYLDMVLGATELGFATTVSHPFLHGKLPPEKAFETLQCYDEGRLRDVLRAAAKAGMAFEINPGYLVHAMDWLRELLQEARAQGTKFTLGSDAHTLSQLGYEPWNGKLDPATLVDELGLRESDLKWAA